MISDHGVGIRRSSVLRVLAREFLNDCSKFNGVASSDKRWAGNVLNLDRFLLRFGWILSLITVVEIMVILKISGIHLYEKEKGPGVGFLLRLCFLL